MSGITLICPHCNSPLKVTTRHLGKKGRCCHCKRVFVMQKQFLRSRQHVAEQEVLTWLGRSSPFDENDEPIDPPAQAPQPPAPQQVVKPAPAKQAARQPAPAAAEPAVRSDGSRFNIHLDHVDEMGAFFHFAPALLHDELFRCSFPQRCVLCGSKENLSVYPVIWSCKLEGARRKETPDTSPYVVKLSEMDNARGRELLAKLKPVKHIPEPFCLPLPYYVCPSCSPVGAVMTHVHQKYPQNKQEQMVEVCELGISSLATAQRFARRVCGENTQAVQRIEQARQECISGTWQALPLAVRNRINQWYHPGPDEKFVAYISDADFAKAEAGAAGLVVTDRRIVFRKSVSRVELDRADQIDVQAQPGRNGHTMLVISQDGQQARMLADTQCVEQITKMIESTPAGLTGHRTG
ncbi:MAG: hypothetical protein ACLFUJ_12335 [Phycisphaerae bacterium]